MTPEDTAYLAGFFDGEGSIVIYGRKTYASAKSKTMPHRLMITLTNTHEPVMHWVHETFGGCLWGYKKAPPGTKVRHKSWKWTLQCRQAHALLHEMLPYLRIKKSQAEVAINFQENVSAYKKQKRGVGRGRIGIPALSPELIAFREGCRQELIRLRHSELQDF